MVGFPTNSAHAAAMWSAFDVVKPHCPRQAQARSDGSNLAARATPEANIDAGRYPTYPGRFDIVVTKGEAEKQAASAAQMPSPLSLSGDRPRKAAYSARRRNTMTAASRSLCR